MIFVFLLEINGFQRIQEGMICAFIGMGERNRPWQKDSAFHGPFFKLYLSTLLPKGPHMLIL